MSTIGLLRDTNGSAVQDLIRSCIASGQGYSATNGLFSSSTGTNNYPLSIFNPSNSGVNIVIYSIQVSNGSGGQTAVLQFATSNPAFSTQVSPLNMKAGGPASALPATSVTMASSNQSISAPYLQIATPVSGSYEMLTNGATIILPNGSNNALVTYIQTYASGINSILMRWIEVSL